MSPSDGRGVIDWARAERTIRSSVARRLSGRPHDVVEEVSSDAQIRLLKLSRREAIRDQDATARQCANYAVGDFLRSVYRDRLVSGTDAPESEADEGDSTEGLGFFKERIEQITLMFFEEKRRVAQAKKTSADCLDLAIAFFESRTWREVADGFGTSYLAIRQRWSRCVRELAGALQSEGALRALEDWAANES